jgi:hypothetical protein
MKYLLKLLPKVFYLIPNALILITFNEIAPHPIPLPGGERGG